MNDSKAPSVEVTPKATPTAACWTGRVLSALIGALFLFSASMKFVGGPEMEEGVAKMGLPMEIIVPIGVVEFICAIIYLVPPTAVIGAILLTGYLGGAILTHVRIGEAVYGHVLLGVLIWLGIFLRERRLWSLIPIRL